VSRDWLDKDFYATLGVSKDASAQDIKKAYKKLARENHPDLNPGDTEAEKRFKEISEASSVLGDEKKGKNTTKYVQWELQVLEVLVVRGLTLTTLETYLEIWAIFLALVALEEDEKVKLIKQISIYLLMMPPKELKL